MKHHYPQNLSPRQPKTSDVVHGTRNKPTSTTTYQSYCGRYAMRCSDNKALVTCKTCLRLMTEKEEHFARLQKEEAERQARLGLTLAEKGTL